MPSVLLRAESVVICGVPFKVESLSDIDRFTVKVGLFGETKLVARDSLEKLIVKTYFSETAQGGSLTPQAMKQFIVECLSAGKVSFAAQALNVLLDMDFASVVEIRQAIAEWAKIAGSQEAFREVVLKFTSAAVGGAAAADVQRWADSMVMLVYWIAREDPAWVRANAVRWVYQFEGLFKSYLTDQYSQAIGVHNLPGAERDLALARYFFGEQDETVEKLRTLHGRIEQVNRAVPGEELEVLYTLLEGCKTDPLAHKVLYPLLAERLHAEAGRALAQNLPEKALMILARLDFERRTPLTHELVLKALTLSKPALPVLVRDPLLELMLRRLSAHDPLLEKAYLRYLERQFNFLLQHGRTEEGGLVLEKLLLVHPDPERKNDNLRLKLALTYLDLGNRAGAARVLMERRTRLSFFERLKLIWAGFYLNRFAVLFSALVFIVCSVVLLAIQIRKLRHASVKRDTGRINFTLKDMPQSESEPNHSFVRAGGGKKTDPRLKEYYRCLALLDLGPQASLRDIKTAYRKAVKHAHPDASPDGRASGRFIELTAAYEKLLKLRQELGLEVLDE